MYPNIHPIIHPVNQQAASEPNAILGVANTEAHEISALNNHPVWWKETKIKMIIMHFTKIAIRFQGIKRAPEPDTYICRWVCDERWLRL